LPGFPAGVLGIDFANRLRQQAQRFGVELLEAQDVASFHSHDNYHCITTASGDEYSANVLLIATGSRYRKLGVPGENTYIGAGVHFCATCDGPFYKGKHVAVIGGGNSAGEESLFLTRFADKVTILARAPELTASKIVVDKIAETPAVEVRTNTEVEALKGDNKLTGLTIRNNKTGATEELHPAGVFVFIGLSPNSGWLPEQIRRDEYGFVVTDATLATSLPGVFAAGDVRKGSTKQAASAAGEGATAALMIREYLKEV
jgi:thioredoxin reductase (NADPH)